MQKSSGGYKLRAETVSGDTGSPGAHPFEIDPYQVRLSLGGSVRIGEAPAGRLSPYS
jgi:hypothetical protein